MVSGVTTGPLCMLGLLALPLTLEAAPAARFTRLSVEQGLSQSSVRAIVQDQVGFLWFGTEEGLNRFDGYGFVVFKHDPRNPRSLPRDVVSALYNDRHGRLWVGTGNSLSLFDHLDETFSRVLSTRAAGVTAVLDDADGTLWVGTEGEGLYQRDPATGAFRQHLRDPHDPASLTNNVVSALLRDKAGRLWVGTRGGGIDRLEAEQRPNPAKAAYRFIHHRHDPRDPQSLSHDEVWGLAENSDGRLWVATYGGGLNLLHPEKGQFEHYRNRAGDSRSIGTDLTTCVFVDRQGSVWVGTDGAGLRRYDAASDGFVASVHDPGDPSSLSQNVIRNLYEDVQGQLWVGTYLGGVNQLKRPPHAFRHFSHSPSDPSSLGHRSVTSFLEDRAGQIWVGTKGGWLHRYERRNGSFVRQRFPTKATEGSPIFALHQDRRGRIWMGTYREGLGRFDPQRGDWAVFANRPGDPRSISNDEVWAIADDGEGALWIGTNTGLDRFDPELGVVTAHTDTLNPAGLGHAGVRALLRDQQGNLWVGTFGGLNLLHPGTASFVGYRHDEREPGSLSHDGVIALHQDRHGRLWVGTFGGGLNRLDVATGRFSSYRGFPSNVIYGIEQDASGRLWLSTNHGLSRFDPASGHTDNFDLTNGLQSLQFNVGASATTRDGRILFGGEDGFYDFDPEAIQPDSFEPPVVFTALRVFNEPVKLPRALSVLEEVTLSHRDRIFSLEFAALDYALPRRNHYAYSIQGFSDQWIQLGSKREVTFTNLDPGSYVFRVRASNSDGVWSDAAAAALRVVVRPPFWRTWWFQGLALAGIALTLVTAHRLRVRHLTADLLERKRAERALRQAEEKYRSIFEDAVEGIFQSTPTGRFVTVNPALARMLGYESPTQMLAEVHDIERQLYVDASRRRELARQLEERGLVYGFESELRRRDGISVWVSETVRAVRDEAGNALYYEGMVEDVSRRRAAQLAESELRAALEKAAVEWELTFDSIDASIMILDDQAKVIRLNRAAQQAAGSDSYEASVGRRVTELGPGEPWRKAEELASAVAQTGHGIQAQVQDPTTARTWDLTATPVLGARAGEQRTIVVARDVTRVVELQDSLRRSETMSAMGSLLAGVAHEVRNPLFGISANLDAFEARFGAQGDHAQLIAVLRAEVERLVALMRDLFDFGRPVQEEPAPGSLLEVVDAAVGSCQTLAKKAGVSVSNAVPARLPPIRMDRKRLIQAFENLLRNAIQHSPAGSNVVVEAAPESQNGSAWLRCAVKDSGPGFQRDDLTAVFRPFFTRRRGGTGLGLAIVQRVVEAHGGSVEAANRPEGGAEVTVWLPCA